MTVPHILLTSSREPTRVVRTLMRDLAWMIPRAARVNRGKMSLRDVGLYAFNLGATYVLIINRWYGGPGLFEFFSVGGEGRLSREPLRLFVGGYKVQYFYGTAPRRLRRRFPKVALLKPSGKPLEPVAMRLSGFFNLPLISSVDEASGFNAYLAFFPQGDGRFRFTFLTSDGVEVGPSIDVKKVDWGVESAV